MKRLTLFLAVVVSMCMTGSAFAQKATVSENFWYNSTATRNLDAEHEMIVTPLLADVAVCKDAAGKFIRVNETRTYWVDCDFTRTQREQWISELKKQAMFECSVAHNADIIVGALVSAQTVDEDNNGETDRDNNRYKVIITVSGYPANYTNFRNASDADYWIKERARRIRKDDGTKIIDRQEKAGIRGQKTTTIVTE